MWFTVEVNMTLICACVPTLRPLAARFSPSLLRNPLEGLKLRREPWKNPNRPLAGVKLLLES